MNIATRCKGLLLGGLLCLSTWALALPGPKDIEASVQAGQFDRAESQLREVLREKPTSARAHYELGQVLAREGRYFEAEQALRQAQIDASFNFNYTPDVVAACIFIALTIPMTRFADWVQRRTERKRRSVVG